MESLDDRFGGTKGWSPGQHEANHGSMGGLSSSHSRVSLFPSLVCRLEGFRGHGSAVQALRHQTCFAGRALRYQLFPAGRALRHQLFPAGRALRYQLFPAGRALRYQLFPAGDRCITKFSAGGSCDTKEL
ncbi:hypothetical protein N7466_001592 [Penicillium verhagenii]|uniref:uncharacterized protein n=1 Tax=Penicillium verhagenii TaxID=1562060 RepID=UPI00254584C2|nr:uncharacterized protein N7466_001592 [Penicillium verhagenii]KAJ5938458.1 hypothetical protein N7466_001592 [Penicillium verhagenii]